VICANGSSKHNGSLGLHCSLVRAGEGLEGRQGPGAPDQGRCAAQGRGHYRNICLPNAGH
jgi:hypothetical protein